MKKIGVSINANKDPYLRDKIENPTCEMHRRINHCNEVFEAIKQKRLEIKSNGGKSTGFELTNIEELRK